jgi:hypothetical protein
LAEELAPGERSTGWLGFLGEAEVIRRLAEMSELDLFRPFPDLETVEVLCRDNRGPASRWCGLQVKTGAVRATAPARARIDIRRSSFVHAASSFLAVLAWMPGGGFHPECLLIPSADIERVAYEDGKVWGLVWEPGSRRRTRVDGYRVPLAELAALVLGRCV